jgi:predicted nucleotidyltransferase
MGCLLFRFFNPLKNTPQFVSSQLFTTFASRINTHKVMDSIVKDKLPALVELCKKYRVTTMYLFGSAATGKFDEKTSDIDLLITFSSEVKLLELADTYFDLMYALDDLFGRKVDLLTADSLRNPYFIESVEQTKQLIYAA